MARTDIDQLDRLIAERDDVLVVLKRLVGWNYVGVRPRVLCAQRVLDNLGTLILEYSRAGNVVPMIVAIDHEFHRLVRYFFDLIHHFLFRDRIDRGGDDNAIARYNHHRAVSKEPETVDVICDLCQVELRCRRLYGCERGRQGQRSRHGQASDHPVYGFFISRSLVVSSWGVRSLPASRGNPPPDPVVSPPQPARFTAGRFLDTSHVGHDARPFPPPVCVVASLRTPSPALAGRGAWMSPILRGSGLSYERYVPIVSTDRGSGRDASRTCERPLRAHRASTQQPSRSSPHLAHAR